MVGREVLRAVYLDGDAVRFAEEVDFHFAEAVERDGEFGVEAEFSGKRGERFEAAEKERFTRAAGAVRGVAERARGVDEERGERLIHTVADEPLNAGCVVDFPLRVDRQRDVCGPSGERAGGQQERVADGFVSGAAAVEHSQEHWRVEVAVIIDLHDSFAVMETVPSPDVLGDGAAPRDGHGE